jgi:lipopolysaccharide export system permease protein
MNIIIALLIFIIYNNLLGVSHSLVATGVIPIWFGFWPIHLVVGLLGLYLLYRRSLHLPLFPQKIKRRRRSK